MEQPKSKLFKDINGKIFGRLLVLEYNGCDRPDRSRKKNHKWKCICECGSEVSVLGDNLRNGNTTSCGCIEYSIKHSMTQQGLKR